MTNIQNTLALNSLENDLQSAFYWMAQATKESKTGDFRMATYSMTVALQKWCACQHDADAYLQDCNPETFAKISASALAKAQEEMAAELAEEK